MTRYAVYGVPGIEPDAPAVAVGLRQAVEDWYDAHPAITVDPRRYGFHATLKAPFRLADGASAAALVDGVAAFAAVRGPVVIPAVRPRAIGAFRALVPTTDAPEIETLAADVVRAFEPFRAPLTPDEVARRRPERLSARQRELLDRHGYPYVLDEFRFHMTLTDSLRDPGGVDDAIASHFAAFDGADIPLTSLAVFVEPGPGARFEVHSVHPFAAAADESRDRSERT